MSPFPELPAMPISSLVTLAALASLCANAALAAPQRFDDVVVDYEYTSGILRTDRFPDERLALADPPLEHPNRFRAHWVADEHRRYWEVLSTTNPKSHWLGWHDGEVWRLYQPAAGTGDVTARKPEQSAVIPSRWFAEVEDEPWARVLERWTVIERHDDAGGVTRVRVRPALDDRTELVAELVAGASPHARRVERYRDGKPTHLYELERTHALPDGTLVPAAWRLCSVSWARSGSDDVVRDVLVWRVELVEARLDPAESARLAHLDFPPRARVENEFSGETKVVGETVDDALQGWIDSFASKAGDRATFPWIRSAPVRGETLGARRIAVADLDLESRRLCGPVALAALHRLRAAESGATSAPRAFESFVECCRVDDVGASVADVVSCSREAGIALEVLSFENRTFPDVRGPFIALLGTGESPRHFAIATRSGAGSRDEWTVREFPDGARRWRAGAPVESWSGIGLFPADDPAVAELIARARSSGSTRRGLLVAAAVVLVATLAWLVVRRSRDAAAATVALALLVASACRPTAAGASEVALRFEPDVVEFGEMRLRESTPRDLVLVNAGERELRVDALATGCSCVAAVDVAGATLAPGASLRIPISWAVQRRAEAAQTVTVRGTWREDGRDAGPAVAVVELRGRVVGDVQVEPPRVRLDLEPAGGAEERTIVLFHHPAREEPALEIGAIACTRGWVRGDVVGRESRTQADGQLVEEIRVRLVSKPEANAPDPSESVLEIPLLGARAERLRVELDFSRRR